MAGTVGMTGGARDNMAGAKDAEGRAAVMTDGARDNMAARRLESLKQENETYWTGRAAGYSEVNKDELRTQQKATWTAELTGQIAEAFPGAQPHELRVLDMGCGPGFFSIILARAGFRVTAGDYTPAMLGEARANAAAQGVEGAIEFVRMDAEALEAADGTFDVVVSRNLTWNLPRPDAAYAEWLRVLKPGGLLLNYDANWYAHLYDAELRQAYEADRQATQQAGIKDEYAGTDIDAMEDIARQMPLSPVVRPAWDESVLRELGAAEVEVNPQVWERVFSPEERVNYASTPMFRVKARKA